jgi:hypothetical protein
MIDTQSRWVLARLVGGGGPFVLAIALASGCGGAPPKQSGEENNFDQTPSGTPAPSEGGSGETPSSGGEGGALSEDQKKQMEIALRRGGDKAANCSQVVPEAKLGKGEVEVTFDGQKGRITDVAVGSPWAGTPVEACIKRSFIGEIIMPFEGDPKAVPYTVELADKKAAPAGTAAPKTPPKK